MVSFTICSNNYIYKAQVLASSIHNLSNVPIYLFLADTIDESIRYKDLDFNKVVYLESLNIPNLQWMKENYSIVELNTAIKPFAFSYIFNNTNTSVIYYFDPDIAIFQPLDKFNEAWSDNNIVLTPHILTPMPLDNKFPDENLFLNHGTYNLGFLGLKRSNVVDELLKWWSDRLLEKCIIDLKEGYFVDQLWFNLVPILFKSTMIIEYYGWNMAYWNLHERKLDVVDGEYIVNNTEPLYFYHFSSFDEDLNSICKNVENARNELYSNESLLLLHKNYWEELKKQDPRFYKSFKYFNGEYPHLPPKLSFSKKLFRKAKSLLQL